MFPLHTTEFIYSNYTINGVVHLSQEAVWHTVALSEIATHIRLNEDKSALLKEAMAGTCSTKVVLEPIVGTLE